MRPARTILIMQLSNSRVVDAGVSQDSAERVRMFLTMAIYRKLGIHVQGQEMSARLSL